MYQSVIAQYSPTFDTVYTSSTESTVLTSTIDNDNGVYSKISGTSYSTGNQPILKIERRNSNDVLLWSKIFPQFYSTLNFIGFDWNNNAFCSSSYSTNLYRINKSTGNFIDSVDVGVSGLNSLSNLSDGNMLITGSVISKLNSNFETMWTVDYSGWYLDVYRNNSLIHDNKLYIFLNHQQTDRAYIQILDLNTGLVIGQLDIPQGQYWNGDLISYPKIKSMEVVNDVLYFTLNFVKSIGNGNVQNQAAIFKLNEGNALVTATEVYRSPINFFEFRDMEMKNNDLFVFGQTKETSGYTVINNKIYRMNINGVISDSITLDNEFTFFYTPSEVQHNLESRFKFLSNTLYAVGYKKVNNVAKKCIIGFNDNLDNIYEFNNPNEGQIKLFSYNNSGCFAVSGSIKASTITNGELYKFCTATASIPGYIYENPFTIFPNPATSQITIQFQNEVQNEMLTIYSISGQKVFQDKVAAENKQFQVNTSHLQSGIYFVEVGSARMKFVVE